MDCFPDFCLGCDKTAVDGLYCSEACRLCDLERSGSVPNSPTQSAHHGKAFYTLLLAPTFTQPPSRYPPPPTKPVSLTNLPSEAANSLARRQPERSRFTRSLPSSPIRVLSPSSSRTSLASTPSADVVSDEAAKELMSYFNAFDRTREERRRSLPGKCVPWAAERALPDSH